MTIPFDSSALELDLFLWLAVVACLSLVENSYDCVGILSSVGSRGVCSAQSCGRFERASLSSPLAQHSSSQVRLLSGTCRRLTSMVPWTEVTSGCWRPVRMNARMRL